MIRLFYVDAPDLLNKASEKLQTNLFLIVCRIMLDVLAVDWFFNFVLIGVLRLIYVLIIIVTFQILVQPWIIKGLLNGLKGFDSGLFEFSAKDGDKGSFELDDCI